MPHLRLPKYFALMNAELLKICAVISFLFPLVVHSETIAVSPAIANAATDPFRSADFLSDSVRRGAEMAQFAGVQSGETIVEFVPGPGYFTRLFSAIAGPEGRLFALWPSEYVSQASNIEKMRAMSAQSHYSNVEVLVQPIAQMRPPVAADLVFTSMNYHDVPDEEMNFTDPAILNRQVFAMLKPGGIYIVFDHVAAAGSGLRDTGTLHRIDPALVRRQVEAAGFIFDGESGAFSNPADPHTDVSFQGPLRGMTDRFLFRFRKPI